MSQIPKMAARTITAMSAPFEIFVANHSAHATAAITASIPRMVGMMRVSFRPKSDARRPTMSRGSSG
jgi:hypothetical protein